MRGLTIGSRVRVHAVLGAILLLVASGGVRADDAKSDHKEGTGQAGAEAQQRAGESSVVTIGGVRVAVDPKTGDQRPLTPAEARKLADEMRRLFKPRELKAPTQRPDGALSAVVAPNVLRFTVARIGPDGSVTTSCVEGSTKAIEQLTAQGTATKPAQPEER